MRSGWQKSDIEGDEVLGIGGFWCGSYRPQGCGVGVWVTLFTASRSGVLSTRDVHQLKVVVSSRAKLQGCELLMSCFERWARVRLGGLEGVMHNGTEPMRACMMHYFFFVRGQAGPLHNCAHVPDAIVTRRGSERAGLTDR